MQMLDGCFWRWSENLTSFDFCEKKLKYFKIIENTFILYIIHILLKFIYLLNVLVIYKDGEMTQLINASCANIKQLMKFGFISLLPK